MALTVSHSTAADGTFSTAGETAWEAAHTVVGSAMAIGDAVGSGTATRVLYVDGSGNLGESANLTFNPTGSLLTLGTDVVVSRSAAAIAMISGDGTGTAADKTGWKIGSLGGGSTSSILMHSALTNTSTDQALFQNASGYTILNAASGQSLDLRINGGTTKVSIGSTAGLGPAITSGTATTDVAALSLTRTNNDASVATGVKWTFTDTTSAAGFLPFQILGTSNGTTNLFNVNKTGGITTGVPAGGTAAAWKFGAVASVTPLVPNRTIELDVNGTIYYLHAKTTND